MRLKSDPPHAHAERVGTVIGGRYQLRRLLGAGGMGAVYEAIDAQEHLFAVKVLDENGASDTREARSRFAREARTTTDLQSPNIARTVDSGVDAATGAPYLVMDLLVGEDLEALLAKTGPLHPTVAVRIVLQICRALAVAHAKGIIHRDLKPSNVFLQHSAHGEVVVKVCDFGIAKILFSGDESLTASGSMIGTPHYMAPEQAVNSKRVDARADVWSVAMLLYRALTGRAAFEHIMALPQLVITLSAKESPPLQEHAPWIDPDLARVVHGALLRDVDARCPSVGALADALRPFGGETEAVFASMLIGVGEEVRELRAPPATLPSRWHDVERRPSSGALAAAPANDADVDRLIGQTLGGRYTLVRLLGAGGMGAVYEARGPDDARVAVKVVLSDADRRKPAMIRRFVREARAAMSIQSAHVVRVIDADADPEEGLPFIVMEYLDGIDVDRLIKSKGALEPAPIVRLFIHACRGLAAAHALGIVHRDIKPANIFLDHGAGGEIVAKICDFGIAKRTIVSETDDTTMDLTRTGGVVGSPMYMSPEQARNAKNVDSRSDIWSLSISLYEALCGQKPWRGTSVGELIIAIATQHPRPLQEVAPWIPPGLAAAVHRGLRREAQDRFATVDELAAALEPFASREAVDSSSLASVSAARRASIAPRAPDVWIDGGSTTAAATSHAGPGTTLPTRRRTARMAVALGGVAFVVVAGVWLARSNQPPVATPHAASAPSNVAGSPIASSASALTEGAGATASTAAPVVNVAPPQAASTSSVPSPKLGKPKAPSNVTTASASVKALPSVSTAAPVATPSTTATGPIGASTF
jgi:serine/threonine protein kinase